MIKKWLPQQDVLRKYKLQIDNKWIKFFTGHPNIKVFVTQGGLQSIEEAINSGMPMVGIPFTTDQPKNVKTLVVQGAALEVLPAKINAELLKTSIIKVASDPR